MPKKALVIGIFLVLSILLGVKTTLASEITGSLGTGLESGLQGVTKAAPTVSPAAGEYHATQSVTLTASSSSALCYTTDATTPACATSTTCTTGTKYSSAISVTSTTTIKSAACYADASTGPVATSTYTLTCATSSVTNGTVSAYSGCTITCNSGYVLSGSECAASGGGGGVSYTPPPTMPTTTTGEVTATPSAGGKTSVASPEGGNLVVELPANAVNASTTVSIVPVAKATVGTTAIALVGGNLIGNYVYNFTAISGNQTITSFSQKITLTLTYTAEQTQGINETTLKINYWDATNSKWIALTSTVNLATKTVTATTDHFTYFALIGQKGVTPTTPSGMTVAQLQAEIIRITALILQLQTELVKLIGVPQSFTADLYYGLKNNTEVKRLQEFLISKGYLDTGLNTGNYLSLTVEAVKAYQTAKGITPVAGYFGPKTRAAVNAELGATK